MEEAVVQRDADAPATVSEVGRLIETQVNKLQLDDKFMAMLAQSAIQTAAAVSTAVDKVMAK